MPATPTANGRKMSGGGDNEPPPPRLSALPARVKLERMIQVAQGHKKALVLTHDNPDPDSLASAMALAQLLRERADVAEVTVGYSGLIGRAENMALVKVLRLPVVPIAQLDLDAFDLLGLVDTQPPTGNHAVPPRLRKEVDIVIDHHPLRDESLEAPFADVGGDFGSTSTMLVEYLRAARLEPSVEVATALFYGLKADTRDLGRETTPTDIDSYLWLFPRMDKQLLGQIEHPELPARYFQMYHTAYERAKVYGDTAIVTDLKEVYSPDMVAEVAERLMFLEGMKWSLAYATFRNQLFLSLRVKDRRMNAGRLIREICVDYGGSAGGHGSMAGARIPLSGRAHQRKAIKRELVERFLQAFGVANERPVALLSAPSP
jgi:nanoRNase/pAp phosphatase (c-di-AMP/oligoRNAs hydrolase)